ncbi:Golgi membrane exchange factor (Ric1p-Rgp1p) subunit [Oleoguttula sp. CCFEE 5521]
MPPPPPISNIRAFVQWKEPSVYAGDEIECIITFRNIASTIKQEDEAHHGAKPSGGDARAAQSSRRSSLAPTNKLSTQAPSIAATRAPPNGRGHRPALSLSVVSAPSKVGLHSAPLRSAPLQTRTPITAKAAKGYHGRSLSIMSLGSEAPGDRTPPLIASTGRKPSKGHMRSASLQVSSKPPPLTLPASGVNGSTITPRQPSPLYESSTPPALAEGVGNDTSLRPARRRPGTVSANSIPNLGGQALQRQSPGANGPIAPDFSFPPRQPGESRPMSPDDTPKPKRSPSSMHSGQSRGTSPRPVDRWSGTLSNLNPIQRVMSDSSAGGTPRSSGEFYSMSNHSDETIVSELPNQGHTTGRLLPPPHARQASRSRVPSHDSMQPETLMMGYAQTSGHFTLDGSLVNAAPFEEVKRKGVQGSGGVVGVERSKRTSGMFGALSWGSIGESMGGLLGGDDTSSMAQMKGTASSKIVPLLSTPQTLLFVDLRLAPGEGRSYHYRFALPRGLPPSHRGRAIKVDYHLVLGLQRPGGQLVKHIDVPFRVLGSVDRRGEILGHDLMSPYIFLQDSARSQSISGPESSTPWDLDFPPFPPKESSNKAKPPEQGLEDFLRYTDRLLASTSNTDQHGALLSPTSPTSPSLSRIDSLPNGSPPTASTREYIDFALLRANQTSSPTAHSPNRFNIARAGQPVAVLTLLRPACRLGEAIRGRVDFSPPSDPASPPLVPTYGLLIELESAERVDPSLALRSASSIQRVTHKIHASVRETTLFAKYVTFNLTVPANATPTFETTGVSLGWRLKIEFTTARQVEGDGEGKGEEGLMDEVGSDERGVTMLAKKRLESETWEVGIPVKVYGAQVVVGDSAAPEGLAI